MRYVMRATSDPIEREGKVGDLDQRRPVEVRQSASTSIVIIK